MGQCDTQMLVSERMLMTNKLSIDLVLVCDIHALALQLKSTQTSIKSEEWKCRILCRILY